MAPPKHSGKISGEKIAMPPKHATDNLDDQSSVSDASDMVDDDYGARTFLLNSSILQEEEKKNRRKRRRAADQEEEDIEEEPRVMPGTKKLDDSSKKLHFLLPVKSSDGGVQMRYRQVEDVEDVAKVAEAKKVAEEKAAAVPAKNTEYKKFGNDPKWKQRVASLAFDVLEDPEKNLKCVRELLSGLVETEIDAAVETVVMASLTEIFKDILPGYRIHIASEVEQDQLMKKETLALRGHEEALLGVYQKFLQQLEKAISVLYKKSDVTKSELAKAGCAVKCLGELLVTRIDFNFRKNLIDSMVHVSTCRYPALVEIAVSTIQRIFKQDRQGDATVDTMSSVSKVAKTKGHKLSPLLLDVFLDVKVSKDLLKSLADEKEKTAKLDRKLLSYKERKHKKEVAKVEKEMQNNQLEENKKLKGRLHSQIIQSVFAIYFRILRREDDKVRMRLLPSVLKGVARFVHFIGVEFMDDLVKTLNGIVESEDCKPLEKLLCVRTVFSILSGDGSSLNIDPHKFYEHLFKVLHSLDGTESRALYIELFHCVQKGFIERRKLISGDRAARCAKGLANLAMRSATKESVAVALLLKSVFIAHPSLDRYLDAEFVSSTVAPGMSGGDIGSASGPLWELHQLRKHHHPANRAIIDALLGNPKALTSTFSKLLHCDPVEYLADASTDILDA